MSESNQLVPQDLTGGPLSTDFDSVVAGADYLPRLQLFGSKSDACALGRIGIGRYGLVKDDVINDLGPEISIAIITWRSKAVRTRGDTPVIIYDQKSPLFEEIKAESVIQDSGCMYGPEFLVWVPDAGTFATYHMNSKTARREAKKMKPLIGGPATLKVRLIENQRFKWHGPVVLPCSTPLQMCLEEEIREQYTKFQNPVEVGIEVADEEENRAR